MTSTRHLLTLVFLLLFAMSGRAQLFFKMEKQSGDRWGVFVKPCKDLDISGKTITGSGQVTVVIPSEASLEDIQYLAGTWDMNARVKDPAESPGKTYVSFGFMNDYPQIIFDPVQETQLFSFRIAGPAAAEPELIDNEKDPFAHMPNSVSTNPGNEISVIDFGMTPTGYFTYKGIYTGDHPSCHEEVQVDTSLSSTNPAGNTTTAVEELEMPDILFTLSPNPTHDWLKITFHEDLAPVTGNIILSTLNGIVLGRIEKSQQPDLSLNVGNLPDGLYIILFESEDGSYLQRDRFLKN